MMMHTERVFAQQEALSLNLGDALRQVRIAVEESQGQRADESVRAKVRFACVLARQESLRVEQVLIRLRDEFSRSTALTGWPTYQRDASEREAVKLLISAYYSDRR